jgi:hypothetical protein
MTSITKTVITVADGVGAARRNTSRRCSRTIASVVLVTAATTTASLLGATAPANAATDDFIAISAVKGNPTPPVFTIGGVAIASDPNKATNASIFNCISNGGGECGLQVIAQNSCVAVAANELGETGSGVDISLTNATESARRKLQHQQGAHIVAEGCSDGQGIFVDPVPPVLAPTVTFNPIIGGLEAHITDRSGVASQCTYTMDNLNRSFALPANSTYNLKIVPAIPKFQGRNVTIKCDNGATTQTTTQF